MNDIFSDKKAIAVFVLPALIFFFSILLLPIVFSGYYSLLKWDGIGKSTFIGLHNFIELFQSLMSKNDGFPDAVANSVILALLSVFVQLPIAYLLAVTLANGIKGESVFRSIYFIPVIVSTIVIANLWAKIYNPQYGLLNAILDNIGLDALKKEWLGDINTALFSVFIPLVWQYIGYHMLLMYAAIKAIPSEIHEAARIDGAGFFQRLVKITFPLTIPIIEICVVFAVIGSLKSFDLIYIMTNGGPLHATEMPTILMFNTIFHKYQYGYGSSIAIFLILECLVFTVLIRQIFRKAKD